MLHQPSVILSAKVRQVDLDVLGLEGADVQPRAADVQAVWTNDALRIAVVVGAAAAVDAFDEQLLQLRRHVVAAVVDTAGVGRDQRWV